MRDNELELSYHQKTQLAWSLIAKLAVLVDTPLAPAILYPANGQYDCVSLLGRGDNVLVHMNRLGVNAEVNNELFTNIWEKALNNPADTARRLVKALDLPRATAASTPNEGLVTSAQLIQLHLEDPAASVDWAWADNDDENRPAESVLENFVIPAEWADLEPPVSMYGWQAWLWKVSYPNNPATLINVRTGEVIYSGKLAESETAIQALADLYIARSTSGQRPFDGKLIPLEVQEVIGNYVYALRDPREVGGANRGVFYVGKGKGNRVLEHSSEAKANPESEKAKLKKIHEIEATGKQVEHFFIRTRIATPEQALAIEQAVIDAFELAGVALTNIVKGHHSADVGLSSVRDVVSNHTASPMGRVTIPFVMLTINSGWKTDLTAEQLFEVSRRFWKVGEEARSIAQYAVIIAYGLVREVYRIVSWQPTDVREQEGKWEFEGSPAPEMAFLVGTSVAESIKKGDASSYHWNLDGYQPSPIEP